MNIKEWKVLQDKMKYYKDAEATARRILCEKYVKGVEMVKGVARVRDTEDGHKYKAEQKFTYSLDVEELRVIWDDLTEEEQACIVTKPSLWESPYKKLPEDSLLHQAIVTKLAMPTLEAELLPEDL